MTTRALVTGGNGFVAHWTVRAMLERGWWVTAGGIGASPESAILSDDERRGVQWLEMDVTRQEDIAHALETARADVIIHLAAVSHVPDAEKNPGHAFEVNTVGTVRLLAEVQRRRASGVADPVVLVVGSAEQYGRHEAGEMPLTELTEQRPLTPYAASKAAQEIVALQTFRSLGIRVVCTRSFNHSGVGHGARFLIPGLVRRALALPPRGGTLEIGNAETVRDFLHVRDAVDAYLALLGGGMAGEVYNVCSGEGVSVRTLAAAVLGRLGISADIATEATLARAVEVPVLVGSNRKLRDTTGWSPRLSRDDIIDDLIHAATR